MKLRVPTDCRSSVLPGSCAQAPFWPAPTWFCRVFPVPEHCDLEKGWTTCTPHMSMQECNGSSFGLLCKWWQGFPWVGLAWAGTPQNWNLDYMFMDGPGSCTRHSR